MEDTEVLQAIYVDKCGHTKLNQHSGRGKKARDTIVITAYLKQRQLGLFLNSHYGRWWH